MDDDDQIETEWNDGPPDQIRDCLECGQRLDKCTCNEKDEQDNP